MNIFPSCGGSVVQLAKVRTYIYNTSNTSIIRRPHVGQTLTIAQIRFRHLGYTSTVAQIHFEYISEFWPRCGTVGQGVILSLSHLGYLGHTSETRRPHRGHNPDTLQTPQLHLYGSSDTLRIYFRVVAEMWYSWPKCDLISVTPRVPRSYLGHTSATPRP